MKNSVTSKEEILKVCRSLIQSKGWSAINIRAVAAACGVSIGSIYNYYDSKSDLVVATISSIWQDIFHISADDPHFFSSLTLCIRWAYCRLAEGSQKYPGFFTYHSLSFLESEKPAGKQQMELTFGHIRTMLSTVLKNDPQVRPNAFDESFTPEKLIELVFSQLLAAMWRQNYDSSAIEELVRRAIY